jgi:hypothetical protein
MALNVMKKLIFVILLVKLASTKEKLAIIDKSLEDLKEFCSNKDSIDFCSPNHMNMAVTLLQRQREVIRKNLEMKEKEQRKSQRIRQKNRMNGEKMIWTLRMNFLDRHI